MKKIMIIGVGWEQVPMVKKAKAMGLNIVLIKPSENNYIYGNKEYIADPRDLNKIEDIFNIEKPDAVIADECDYSMYAVAYLSDKYDLPGPSLKVQTITNNKFLQRKIIDKCNVKQPKYKSCWNLDMAISSANEIGYPVIVKPTDNRGSIGVVSANNDYELKNAWYNSVLNSHSRTCIVEKFIDGDVITLEGFHDSEKLQLFAISTKDTYEESKNVAKVLYYPGKISMELYKEVQKLGKIISNHIGIDYGFVHIEFMISKDSKEIYFIEIANRGGGVHISNRILPELTGIDFMNEYLNMSLNKRINITWDKTYKNKIVMYFIKPEGKCNAKDVLNEHSDKILVLYLKSLNEVRAVETSGALGRVGVVIVKEKTFESALEICRSIENKVSLNEEEFYSDI